MRAGEPRRSPEDGAQVVSWMKRWKGQDSVEPCEPARELADFAAVHRELREGAEPHSGLALGARRPAIHRRDAAVNGDIVSLRDANQSTPRLLAA